MSYIALYRKWRPLVFEDVVEQEHVVKTLRHSVSTGRIAHAYLFCGTRGTGKTTMAKILSRAINCLSPKDGDPCNECEICRGILDESILDVVEIDAASNNSVDNVREIRDEVVYAPTRARYKVYIIDEVHMLSTGAFNALLKTLEEPPAHVVFILATTDPHKLPATILSRCQRFDFRRISVESIAARLSKIAESNGVAIQEEALRLIARVSDGALRDAISILDQCLAVGNSSITYDDVLAIIGMVTDELICDMVDCIKDRNIRRLLDLVDKLVMDGKDITQFVSDLVLYYRNMLICKMVDNSADILEVSAQILQKMKSQSEDLSQEEIILTIKELSSLESSMKWASHPRILLEVALIKLCEKTYTAADSSLEERLAILEKRISSGSFVQIPSVQASSQGTQPAVISKENSATNEGLEGSQMERPVKGTASPASSKPSTPLGTENRKELSNWNDIVAELKNMGRVQLFTFLIGTKAIEIDDSMIGIVFPPEGSFTKLTVSKHENLEIIQDLLQKKLGREIRVRCYNEGDAIASSKSEGGGNREGEKDDLLEKAEKIAHKLNVPINVIDE